MRWNLVARPERAWSSRTVAGSKGRRSATRRRVMTVAGTSCSGTIKPVLVRPPDPWVDVYDHELQEEDMKLYVLPRLTEAHRHRAHHCGFLRRCLAGGGTTVSASGRELYRDPPLVRRARSAAGMAGVADSATGVSLRSPHRSVRVSKILPRKGVNNGS